jgi:phage terminase large subunit-like protein
VRTWASRPRTTGPLFCGCRVAAGDDFGIQRSAASGDLDQAIDIGMRAALEDELCGLVTGGGYEGPGRSPDRADALVWAVSELLAGVAAQDGRAEVVMRPACARAGA